MTLGTEKVKVDRSLIELLQIGRTPLEDHTHPDGYRYK